MKIIAATNNKDKIVEFRQIISDEKFDLVPVSSIINCPDIEENGSSFEENSALKALAVAKFAKAVLGNEEYYTIADDSGLEIFSLDLRPGIFSARYAPSNPERIQKVLDELKDFSDRRARFVCVATIATDGNVLGSFRGEVYGSISFEPLGSAGFGYDPIFKPDGYDLTFAQLGLEVKNKISHRSKALRQAFEFLYT